MKTRQYIALTALAVSRVLRVGTGKDGQVSFGHGYALRLGPFPFNRPKSG